MGRECKLCPIGLAPARQYLFGQKASHKSYILIFDTLVSICLRHFDTGVHLHANRLRQNINARPKSRT